MEGSLIQSWRRTGKPGLLQSMKSQTVGRDLQLDKKLVQRLRGTGEGGENAARKDLHFQERCPELGLDCSKRSRPKLRGLYKLALSLPRDEVWLRDGGRL